MRSAFPATPRRLPGRRAMVFALVVLLHLVLALLFIFAQPGSRRRAPEPATKLFQILAPRPAPTPPATTRARRAAKGTPAEAPLAVVVAPKPKIVLPSADTRPFTTELFDAVDIAALPNRKGEAASSEGRDPDSVAAYGPGAGPGGAPLYPAEWVREPTRAELAAYAPTRGVPDGSWAVIACKTIARNRVEDCYELGESTPGAGLSRGLRQAAWQFLVRRRASAARPRSGRGSASASTGRRTARPNSCAARPS